MKAIQIEGFGKPVEVVKVVEFPDVGAPGAGEVVLALEALPINQYDLLMIAGGYGYRPRLPAIMGTEGVGRVVAVSAGVKHLKEGDRTLVPFLHPTWAEHIKTDAPWLRPLPQARSVRHAGCQPADRLSPADRHRAIAARMLGHPEWRLTALLDHGPRGFRDKVVFEGR
jgi:NADPH:quinone reductase-like Zn-dependent oxidoreductase